MYYKINLQKLEINKLLSFLMFVYCAKLQPPFQMESH